MSDKDQEQSTTQETVETPRPNEPVEVDLTEQKSSVDRSAKPKN